MLYNVVFQRCGFAVGHAVGMTYTVSRYWVNMRRTLYVYPIFVVLDGEVTSIDHIRTSKPFNRWNDKDCKHIKAYGQRLAAPLPAEWRKSYGMWISRTIRGQQFVLESYVGQYLPICTTSGLSVFDPNYYLPFTGGFRCKSTDTEMVCYMPFYVVLDGSGNILDYQPEFLAVRAQWGNNDNYGLYVTVTPGNPDNGHVTVRCDHPGYKKFWYLRVVPPGVEGEDERPSRLFYQWTEPRDSDDFYTNFSWDEENPSLETFVPEKIWDGVVNPTYKTLVEPEYYRTLIKERLAGKVGRSSSTWKEKWDELARDAVRDLRSLVINSTMYLRDLYLLWRVTIKPILEAKGKLTNPKTIAGLYLNYRYGIRLFIKDSIKIFERIKKELEFSETGMKYRAFTGRARRRFEYEIADKTTAFVTYTYHLKTGYQPAYSGGVYGDILSIFSKGAQGPEFSNSESDTKSPMDRELRRWDAVLTALNAWDLLPFSFIVDWFIPVSEYLERLEMGEDLVTFKVESQLFGSKVTIPITPESAWQPLPGWDHYTIVVYERWHKLGSLLDAPELNIDFGTGLSFKHFMDGLGVAVVLFPERLLRRR